MLAGLVSLKNFIFFNVCFGSVLFTSKCRDNHVVFVLFLLLIVNNLFP